MKMNVYCDESGNSGYRISTKDQKFFVYSGIKEKDLRNRRKALSILEELNSQKNAELKGRNIIKNISNTDLDKLLIKLENLISLGYEPVIAVVEKKFFVSCFMVDIIFDHDYNRLIPEELNNYINGGNPYEKIEYKGFIYNRRILADIFYNIINNFDIEYFNKIFEKIFENKFEKNIMLSDFKCGIKDLLKKILNSINENEALKELIKSGEDNIDIKIEEVFSNDSEKIPLEFNKSINLFSFGTLMNLVEITDSDKKSINFIVDNLPDAELTKNFEEKIKEIVNKLPEYNNITGIKCFDSKEMKLIQLADIISYLMFYYLNTLINKRDEESIKNCESIKKFLYKNFISEYNAHYMINRNLECKLY